MWIPLSHGCRRPVVYLLGVRLGQRDHLTEPRGYLVRCYETDMRPLALLVAIFVLLVGITGVFFPEGLLKVGHHLATPVGLYVAAALRVGIGLVLALAAVKSRTPKTLRVLGIITIMGGLTTPFLGVERTRAILDWWSAQGPVLMRLGPAFALIVGGFIVYAVAPRRGNAS